MPDYQLLYTTLFNAFTDAIALIEKMNFGAAKGILMEAQCKSEELFIESDDRYSQKHNL